MDKGYYISKKEIREITGVGSTKASQIIKKLNNQLIETGYEVIGGKVPRKFFFEKFLPHEKAK